MATQLEFLRSLLLAHFQGDDGAFRTAAWEIVENEKRVNRSVVASELERIIREATIPRPTKRDGFSPLNGQNGVGTSPKDKDKNASLLELVEPQRLIDDLVLSAPTRLALDRIVGEWKKSDLLKSHGLKPITKVLFHGPPGCGKSVAAESLAKALFLPLATVKFDALVSSYLGETATNLRRVFDYARARPMVLLFDEFDAIGRERSAVEEHGELKRVVNSFLQLLDGFRADTLTVAATNHEGLLDPALWRRFDEVVVFPPPSSTEIEHLLVRHFRQIPLATGIKLKEITRSLEGASHADIERVAVDAIKQTVMQGQATVGMVSLKCAVERLRERLRTTQTPNESAWDLSARPRHKKPRLD